MLSNEKVKEILESVGWSEIIGRIFETFVEEAMGRVESPPKTIMHLPGTSNDYRVMPSRMFKYPYCGTKIIAAAGDNPQKGRPLAVGVYILNENECQETVLVSRAEEITAYRTAAATAVAVDLLSSYNTITLGVIGCGVQAEYHIPAIGTIRNIRDTLVADIDEKREDYICERYDAIKYPVKDIMKICNVIITLTPTREPHIFMNDLDFTRNMLICAIGGDSDKKIEIEHSVLPFVDHFCDSYEQVSHVKMIHRAVEDGLIDKNDLKSLGSYIVGDTSKDGSKPTKMFLSTGVALEDLTLAILVYESGAL